MRVALIHFWMALESWPADTWSQLDFTEKLIVLALVAFGLFFVGHSARNNAVIVVFYLAGLSLASLGALMVFGLVG